MAKIRLNYSEPLTVMFVVRVFVHKQRTERKVFGSVGTRNTTHTVGTYKIFLLFNFKKQIFKVKHRKSSQITLPKVKTFPQDTNRSINQP